MTAKAVAKKGTSARAGGKGKAGGKARGKGGNASRDSHGDSVLTFIEANGPISSSRCRTALLSGDVQRASVHGRKSFAQILNFIVATVAADGTRRTVAAGRQIVQPEDVLRSISRAGAVFVGVENELRVMHPSRKAKAAAAPKTEEASKDASKDASETPRTRSAVIA